MCLGECGRSRSSSRSTTINICTRSVKVGDLLSVTNQGVGVPWLPGVIESMSSPEQGIIRLEDGHVIRRHIDHLQHHAPSELSGRARSPGRPEPFAQDDDSPDPHLPNTNLLDTDTATPQQPVEPTIPPVFHRSTHDRHPQDHIM